MTQNLLRALLAGLLLSLVAACGGGGSSEEAAAPPATKQCQTSDAEPDPNDNDCAQIYVGVTDADGDFLSYQVDVSKLSLVRSDGVRVELLPIRTRIDFSQYVELSELVTAATVPVGRYVSAEITLDYRGADIQVEKNGAAVAATAVGADGNALTDLTLTMQLASGRPLLIAPRIPAMLQLDFNLAASNTVNLALDPVTVTVDPVMLASIEPVDEREFRLRGPLLSVNVAESFYRAALRPFWDRDSRRGGVRIYTDADSSFLINGEAFSGNDGLTALASQTVGTATLAFGSYQSADHRFVADEVWAGSSVPGGTLDAVEGVVVARTENTLTVFGGSLVRASGTVSFRETLTLTLDDQTRVAKPRLRERDLPLSAISVGQRITALGTLTRDDVNAANLAADVVLLRLSSVGGTLLMQQPDQLNLNLQGIAGLSPARFNFAGTGTSADVDANASDYEVAVPNSLNAEHDVGAPIRALGYVRGFGSAPADFDAVAVQDFSAARAQILIGFGSAGSNSPFSSASDAGLVVDLQDEALGGRHHLLRGGLHVDLLSLTASPLMAPPSVGHGWYALRTGNGMLMFSDYSSFVAEMNLRLAAGGKLYTLHALGGYRDDSNTFTLRALTAVLR